MPRQKKIATEELLRLVDEYCVHNTGVAITIPSLGNYIRTNGYDVGDYLIRRNNDVRAQINGYNQTLKDETEEIAIVYHGLDVDAFLAKNRTPFALRAALVQRDTYYAKIASHAAAIKQRNHVLKQENTSLQKTVKSLEKEQEDAKAALQSNRELSKTLREQENIIKALKRILDDYVYPEMANLLLQKDGIFESLHSYIDAEQLDKTTMTANTDIEQLQYDVVRDLIGDLDE